MGALVRWVVQPDVEGARSGEGRPNRTGNAGRAARASLENSAEGVLCPTGTPLSWGHGYYLIYILVPNYLFL